ncbi:hypothetical protein [Bradyrhizobium sp. BWA-3-5]|uniref:hypothetical protein n=1 Tax=Bradyrhizobium sp. BWA-3-5 TaxID=3080013 RepID=UPI00293E348C|nr:hypothetical protein [Bradyrhizobium sp. BWA-3-5]WOH64004.1 hypothetical protein RX331_25695 [Bradyrhizobium sp. BWA-3-5]
MSTLHKSVRSLSTCILAFAGSVHAQSTDKIITKLGHTLGPDNHYQLTALEFAKAVKAKTKR